MPSEPRPKPSRRPRYRYVLVRVEPGGSAVTRPRLIELLRERLPPSAEPWVTRYNGEHAVLRVARGQEKAVQGALEAEQGAVRFRPLSTSGTIAGLERRFRQLGLER